MQKKLLLPLNQRIGLILLNNKPKAMHQLNMMHYNYLRVGKQKEADLFLTLKKELRRIGLDQWR